MSWRSMIAAFLLAVGSIGGAQAQHLQPGMRTMMQQGGAEGVRIGPVVPIPYGADPYYSQRAGPDDGYVHVAVAPVAAPYRHARPRPRASRTAIRRRRTGR